MQVFVNERKVKLNRSIGRWASLGGLAVLIVGMIVSLRSPQLIWVSMLSLLIGFLSSTVGAYYASHWARSPRADEVLTQALKGISNQYHLYHYLLPVSHVLLGPAGLFLFRTYLHEGSVTYDGRKWRQKRSLLRSLGFGGIESLADPVQDARYDVQRFRRWLAQRYPAERIPEIVPFVVFVRDGVELNVADTEVPVLRSKQLKAVMRRIDKESEEVVGEQELYEIERAMLGNRIDEL
jgi:Nuclease-related domain